MFWWIRHKYTVIENIETEYSMTKVYFTKGKYGGIKISKDKVCGRKE